MIRRCDPRDFESIWTIINDGAQAYKGTIPADRWTEPYMSREKLQKEIDEGVVFWGYEDGGKLLSHLRELASRPILIGTWADAAWAIQFYERHGFQLVGGDEKDQLLK